MVSIIIVNYNTFQITCDCIDTILRYTQQEPYEIVLVDNASPNDNPDLFLARYPSITLIKSPVNGGFAKGNNLGIAAAHGDVILLLNSDTLLTEDSISSAARYYRAHKDIGALTVRLTYTDGKLQHTARKFRSIKRELLDLLRPLLLLLPYKQRASLMLNQYFNGDFNTYCDWVSGAFLMCSKELIEKLPGKKLDDRFFMYGEDELWCYQFTELGYRNFYLSETTVIHILNASTDSGKQLRLTKLFISREMEIVAYAHGKGLYYHIFRLIFQGKEMLRYGIKVAVKKLFNRTIR